MNSSIMAAVLDPSHIGSFYTPGAGPAYSDASIREKIKEKIKDLRKPGTGEEPGSGSGSSGANSCDCDALITQAIRDCEPGTINTLDCENCRYTCTS